MPSQTFYNLDPKKRTKFIKTSFKEFSAHDYNTASVSEIVRKLGIAKGSVYQYFQNKQDLFFYLIDLSIEEKEMYFESDELNKAKSFTSWYKLRVQAKLNFDKEKAMFSNLLSNFYLQRNNSELRQKYLSIRNREFCSYVDALQRFTKAFKPKADLEKTAAVMLEIEQLIPEYPEIAAGKKVPAKGKSIDVLEDLSDGFIDLITGGLVKGRK